MAWFRVRALPLLALLLPTFGTGSSINDLGGVECDELSGGAINFNVDWQTQIKPIFNENFPTGRCTSCHNAGQLDGQLDLTDQDIDAIVKILSGGLVEPGRPQASILFDKVNCGDPGHGGRRMPYFQNPLTLAEQALIFDWIAQGAPGDIEGEPPFPREFIFRDGGESVRRY